MKCSSCGKEFVCDIKEGKNDCWCFDKPKRQPDGYNCYCEDCLIKK